MEMWKNIAGYEKYQVSNHGRVRSIDYNHTGQIRELAQNCNRGGYMYVNLYNQGKRKTHMIHRLVAEAFLENPEQLPVINHIDCDKRNNHVSNLEFCTISHNTKHAYDNGLINTEESRRKAAEANRKKVICLTTGKVFDSIQEASSFYGAAHQGISACCKGKVKSAGKLNGKKLIWKYI